MYSEDIKEDNLWLMKGDCLERMKDFDPTQEMVRACGGGSATKNALR